MPQTATSTQIPEKWYAIAVTDPNIASWYAQLKADHPDEPESIIDHMMRSINDYGDGSGQGYDYRTAIEKGLRPSLQPDGKYHWGGDVDDVIVKGEQHPTRHLTDQSMVQQTIDQNSQPGRVQQIQKQEQDQKEVIANYQDLMKMYPESWSTVKSMMKEGVFDLATISRAVRLEAEKKTGTPKKRTTAEKVAAEYSSGREGIINDLLWFENIMGLGNVTEEQLMELTKEAEERMAADPIDAEGWFEEILLPFSSILYGMFKSAEYGAGGALAAMTPVAIAGQLVPGLVAVPEELITLPAAGALGAKAGVASFWYMQGTGSIYKELRMSGVDPTLATAVASVGGVPYALLEQAQMKGLVPKAFTNEFKDLLTKSVGRTLLNIGKQTGKTYTKENIQELGQESILIASEEVGAWLENKVNDGEIDQATADEILERMLATAEQSAKAFVIPVGLGGAVSAGTGVSKVRKEQKLEAASIEATAVSRLSPEGVAGVTDEGEKVTLGRPAQLRVETEEEPVEKRKTEEDALSEVNAALEAGETTPGVAALAKHLIGQDPDFDVRSSLDISNEVLTISDDYIRNVLGKEPEQFFKEEGITREEAEEYFATGSTQVDIQKGVAKTAIKLYQGHDADTLVEEWYHDFYEHMDAKDRKAFEAYHEESGDERSIEEHFGQEGRDFFFSEKLHEKAGGIRAIFDKARQSLKDLIARIRTIRGAKIPKKIQGMYTAAAERQLTPLTKKQSADLKKRKMQFQLRAKPKSKEFKSWFGDSKVVDEKGKPLVVYHGTDKDFDQFDKDRKGTNFLQGGSIGFFFAPDPSHASQYAEAWRYTSQRGIGDMDAGTIYPVYLNVKNPYITDVEQIDLWESEEVTQEEIEADVQEIKDAGHDGIFIYRDVKDAKKEGRGIRYPYNFKPLEIAVFEPNQIKGQFNPKPTKGPKIMHQARKKKKKPDFPRVKKTGKYHALPDKIDTPQKLFGLVTRLVNMAKEGREGRYWYERSSDAILTAVNGDQKEAQKIAGLVGLFSQGTGLLPNWRAALRYYLNSKAGKPSVEGRFPGSMVPKAEKIMKGVIPLGIKTNNFYTNLMRHIDPGMKQGVTVDLWMMRALGYKTDAPGPAQYDRVSKLITLAAERLGWEPHQVQSAVWTTIKSKWEAVEKKIKAEAISKGHFIKATKVDGKKVPGYWKNEPTRIRYRNKFLKAAFKVPSSKVKSIDFADLMVSEISTITMETVPGVNDYFTKVNTERDYVQLNDMQVALNRLIIDETGNDRLAQAVGILVMEDMSAPGAWLEKVSPGRQLGVVAPKGKKGDITEAVEDQIQEYVALFGSLFHQWGVGYHKPMAEKTIKRQNLAEVEFHDNVRLTPEESRQFTVAMAKEIETRYGKDHIHKVYLAPSPTGYRWINLSDNIQNKDFHNLVDDVTEKTFPNYKYKMALYKAHSNLIYHSEKDAIENNGKSYKEILSRSPRSEIYRGLLGDIAPQVNQVYQDYAGENNWGKAPEKDQKIVFAVRHKRLIPKDKPPKQTEFDSLELDPETYFQWFQRGIQDKMNRLEQVMEKVEEKRDLSDEENVYMAQDLYIGKAKEILTKFQETTAELLDRIIDAGYTIDDFGEYLHARHAEERNDHVAKINDKLPDGGSGMFTEDANEILAKYEGDEKIEALAKEFYRKVTKRALRMRLNSGLIDRATFDKLTKYYENYVPLFVVKEIENPSAPSGKGLSIPQRAELKRVTGSLSTRGNPVWSATHDMSSLIRRAEKNKVGLLFLDLTEQNPSEAWTVGKQQYRPVYNKDGELEFMDPKFDLSPNTYAVRREGKLFLIDIHDQALADGMKNLGIREGYKILNTIGGFIRAVVTTFSPEFVLTNFTRDIQTALTHVGGEYKGLAGTVAKNTFPAMGGVIRNVRDKKSNYWSKRYDELKKAGGKIGWFDHDDLTSHQAKIERMLKNVEKGKGGWGAVLKAGRGLGELVEHANESVESAVRLSVFDALVNSGVSVTKAATVAKGITVNFNKKGRWGVWANSLWLFWNATVQGTWRMAWSVAKHRRTRRIVGAMVANSMLISLKNWYVDPEEWEEKEDWEKDNFMYLWHKDDRSFIRIRVPYGLNMFHVMGTVLGDVMYEAHKHGVENVDVWNHTGRVFGAISDAVNPLGTGSAGQAISPTAFDPIVQLSENKNFMSTPIVKEKSPYGPETADYTNYYKKRPPTWLARWVTRSLSLMTGGEETKKFKQKKDGTWEDRIIPGKVDVSPDAVDHVLEFFTGGLGKFISRSINATIDFAVGEKTNWRQIPFVRQFYHPPDKSGRTQKRLIYKMLRKSKTTKYNHVEVSRFKKYVYKGMQLQALKEDQIELVKDIDGNEVPKIIRDFMKNQRWAWGIPEPPQKRTRSRSRKRSKKR